MRNNWMSLPICLLLGGSLTFLPGCGGGGRAASPTKSASSEIAAAKRSMESAQLLQSKGEWDLAMAEIKNAQSKIKEGLGFASGPDKRALQNLDDDARSAMSYCEAEKMKAPPKLAKPQDPVQVAVVDTTDPKKKEREAKEKQDAEAAAKRQKELKAKIEESEKAVPKKQPKEEEPAAVPAAATKDGEKKAGGAEGAEGEKPEEAAKPKGIGPFPPVTENSPEINIVKVTNNGKFAFAYFQLYNKGDNGKRIMGVTVVFKDKDNAPMTNANQSITVPFEGFSEKAKDPTENPNALTLGSHSIDGHGALQLVGVCQHDRAKDIKKVGIRVAYDDQSSVADSGPSAPGAAEEKEDPDKTKVRFK